MKIYEKKKREVLKKTLQYQNEGGTLYNMKQGNLKQANGSTDLNNSL